MAGTKAGGKLAAQRNKEKYGEYYYQDIGAEGGKASNKTLGNQGGFFGNPELARRAGQLGGKASGRKRNA
jgi:general stress protein YciG